VQGGGEQRGECGENRGGSGTKVKNSGENVKTVVKTNCIISSSFSLQRDRCCRGGPHFKDFDKGLCNVTSGQGFMILNMYTRST
jgi:hypothetical protein